MSYYFLILEIKVEAFAYSEERVISM